MRMTSPDYTALPAEAYPIRLNSQISVIKHTFFILLVPYMLVSLFKSVLHLIELSFNLYLKDNRRILRAVGIKDYVRPSKSLFPV